MKKKRLKDYFTDRYLSVYDMHGRRYFEDNDSIKYAYQCLDDGNCKCSDIGIIDIENEEIIHYECFSIGSNNKKLLEDIIKNPDKHI
jgi:hypothetical protein